MYKVIWITKFNPELSREEARRWWLEEHGSLVLATPGLKRYVQNHWLETNPWSGSSRSAEDMDFDGHAEAWFESREAFDAAMVSPEFQRAIADVGNCFDPSTLSSGVVNEYVMKWDALPGWGVYEAPSASR
jgi:uncharacterized protein (TIGR02118 family)